MHPHQKKTFQKDIDFLVKEWSGLSGRTQYLFQACCKLMTARRELAPRLRRKPARGLMEILKRAWLALLARSGAR